MFFKQISLILTLSLIFVVLLMLINFQMQNYRFFVITSGSMEPALTAGTLVITKPQARYFPGQVIAYYSAGRFRDFNFNSNQVTDQQSSRQFIITHRIIAYDFLNGDFSYRTKGDANAHGDETQIKHREVIGQVWLSFPLLGLLFSWLYSRVGLRLLLLAPAIALIADQCLKIIKTLYAS